MEDTKENKSNFVSIFIAIVPYIIGLYFEWGSLFSTAALLCYLFYILFRRKKFTFFHSKDNILVFIIFLSAILSSIFGTCPGRAAYGIFRILGLILLILIMMQSEELSQYSVSYLSLSGIIMLAFSLVLALIPNRRFLVYYYKYGENRFAAFIQYPNVTALFFILAFIVFVYSFNEKYEKIGLQEFLLGFFVSIFLSAGICMTQSRFGIILHFFILLFFAISDKRLRKIFLPILILVAMGAIIYINKRENFTLSEVNLNIIEYLGEDKSFQTRLFQYSDAMGMIIRHPLGLGFMSYYELLPTFQEAQYYVRYVHNGYLSITFSFGWLAGISFILLIISKIKKASGVKKLLLITISIHFLFDTALDFMAIAYIFAASMDFREGERKEFSLGKKFNAVSLSIFPFALAFFLWLGVADLISYFSFDNVALKLNPFNYEYFENALFEKPLTEENLLIAKRAVELNPYSDTGLDF